MFASSWTSSVQGCTVCPFCLCHLNFNSSHCNWAENKQSFALRAVQMRRRLQSQKHCGRKLRCPALSFWQMLIVCGSAHTWRIGKNSSCCCHWGSSLVFVFSDLPPAARRDVCKERNAPWSETTDGQSGLSLSKFTRVREWVCSGVTESFSCSSTVKADLWRASGDAHGIQAHAISAARASSDNLWSPSISIMYSKPEHRMVGEMERHYEWGY